MEQIILYGKEGLKTIIEQQKIKRVFLVCGETSFKKSGAAAFIDSLSVQTVRFTAFSPNPKYEEVCCGVKLFKASESKVILAVGGGSSMDVAKCIRLYATMDETMPFYAQQGCDSDVLLIAMPTTAGSGSESTCHAVLYRDKVKQSISRAYLRPACAVLAHEFLCSLPMRQKKSTLLDALCQGIESYWARSATKESRIYAVEALRIIKRYWKAYIMENCQYREMMYAANLAGRAIHISRTTAPHALSYGLTSQYKIPHGHAVALCMEQVWGYTMEQAEKMKDVYAQDLNDVLRSLSMVISYKDFCEIMRELKMESPLAADKERDIEILSQKVNADRLGNHPIALEKKTIVSIYERIVKPIEY